MIAPQRSSVGRSTAAYAGGNLIAMGLRIVAGILTCRFVDPAVLGLFNGIGLVTGYAPLLLLGVVNGLNRDYPYYVGRGEQKRALVLASTTQAWSCLVGILSGLGLLSFAVYHGVNGRWQLSVGWGTFAVLTFVTLFGDVFLAALFRSCGSFMPLARLSVYRAVLRALMVLLVWWFGFYGLCMRELLLAGFVLGFLWLSRPIRERPRLDRGGLLELGKTGAPIFVVGELDKLWGVLNSTLVLRLTGTAGLGRYALAALIGPAIIMIPQALSQVAYPRMAEEYGRTGRTDGLLRIVRRPLIYAILCTTSLAVFTLIALPPAVRMILPKYVDGIEAGQWTAVSTIVLSALPINNIFNVVKRQKLYTMALLTGMLTYLAALMLLTRSGVRLEAFPQAMLIGRSVSMCTSLCLAGNILRREERSRTAENAA